MDDDTGESGEDLRFGTRSLSASPADDAVATTAAAAAAAAMPLANPRALSSINGAAWPSCWLVIAAGGLRGPATNGEAIVTPEVLLFVERVSVPLLVGFVCARRVRHGRRAGAVSVSTGS